MPTSSGRMRVAVAASCVWLAGCGQKGPPLAPLHLVPAAATELSARRIEDQVRLRLVLPTTNANGPGPVALDRVEIYAVTAWPASTPPNRELMTKPNLVGQIEVRPPVAEGEQPKEGDIRPEPGTAVVFDDQLTAEKLKPLKPKVPVPPPQTPATAPPSPPPATPTPPPATPTEPSVAPTLPPVAPIPPPAAAGVAAPAAAAVPVSTDPMRIYVVRGVTKSGRAGPPSARVQVPVVPLPPAPGDVTSRVTETAVALEWRPPAEAPPTLAFNVYRADAPLDPLNPAPLTAPAFEVTGVQFGQQHCFRVRSVLVSKSGPVEGPASDEKCVTPIDVFPPATPATPNAVPTPGEISLIWDPNKEKDVAGYLVLRGEAPDGMLQPLTPGPIRETAYRDTTVKPGVRYFYAIVAVDEATPPNASPQSARVEETAR